MKAVARYVDEDGPLPHYLMKAWQCRNWRTLPKSGGLDEQPLFVMSQMEMALYVYDAFRSRANRTDAPEWAEKHPDLAEFCLEVDSWN